MTQGPSFWGEILVVVNMLLYVWFGFLILYGSWKLFRFLIKWRP